MTTSTPSTLRLYAFAHSWLSGVQKGIQTTHAACDLVKQWGNHKMTDEWVSHGKTVILLEGGSSRSLDEMNTLLSQQAKLPYMDFKEDEDSLEGARTAVVVVIPQSMYEFEFIEQEDESETYKRFLEANPKVTNLEFVSLLEILKRARKARLAT